MNSLCENTGIFFDVKFYIKNGVKIKLQEKILKKVEELESSMVESLTRICRIPAISPHNGGTGEEAKLLELEKIISELKLGSVEWHRVEDEKSETGNRPSIFLDYPGKSERRLCILTHVDVVPEGDLSAWSINPFEPVVKGTRLYGRGVSDNGMCLISSLFALKAIHDLKIVPEYTVRLGFIADEEMGSNFGLKPLIERGLFKSDDLVIAPDSGNDSGDFIEIAEKADLKMKFTVIGKQVHAALPHTGLNACRVANKLAYDIDEALHKAFPNENEIFEPSFSTFEPTRRFQNVPNVNTVPGREVFEFDCRILPEISLDEVIGLVKKICIETEKSTNAKIIFEFTRGDSAPITSSESDIAKLLIKSIRAVFGKEPVTGGVGGGTFAAFFRRKGIPAVVWSQECEGVAHQPDEYTEIKYLVNNAKVFALMMSN